MFRKITPSIIGRYLIVVTLSAICLPNLAGCSRRVELPQDAASQEQRRQRELEFMHREQQNK